MPTERFEEIRALPLFSKISDASFGALIRGACVQSLPPQTRLISEGGVAEFLHIIALGSVELFASWSGRNSCMGFLGPRASFILAATIGDRPYLISARTMTRSRIIMIPSEDIRALLRRNCDFARSVATELAACCARSVRQTKNIKLRNSVERLANYIVKHHARAGGCGTFALEVEKKKLASLLGMTPENLSRAFAALKTHGVEVSGSSIKLNNPADLRAYARPCSLIDGQA